MERFLKGIVVGLGGVAPGLSGSVLLIIFGLYRQTLDAIGTLLTDFRKKIRFLLPLVCGMVLGVLLFSKLIDFLIHDYEMPTRFCFLGLILGTLPMVWKEVKRDGFFPKYYLLILLAALLGLWMFTANADAFPQVTDPNLLQCILLGVCVAATAIVPGVDPAVFLSTLGFYEMYVGALADLDFGILIPMVPGLALGAMGISFLMSLLFKRFYTGTYSVIFGIFLSMIPNMLTENCVLGFNGASVLSLVLLIAGFLLSFWLGDLERNNAAMRSWLEKRKRR
jgi:putative membrane protein